MKDANHGLRRFAGIQMLIALAWLVLPFVIWRCPVEDAEWTLGLYLRDIPHEAGLLVCFPLAMLFLVSAIGLWKQESWARRTSLVLHAANGVINGSIAGLSILVFVIVAFFVPSNHAGPPYFEAVSPFNDLVTFCAYLTRELVGPLLLVSVAFSLYSLRYLRRSHVRRSCEQDLRPFQFTLRGAFLAMTFATVYVAAFISWSSWQDEEQRVRQLGGYVSWHAEGGTINLGFERIAPGSVEEFLRRASDEYMALIVERFRPMRHMSGLDLSHSLISDNALFHLDRLPNLRRLDLRYTRVTDRGLKHLAELRELTSLELERTAMTDVGLEHLRSLNNLTFLNLRRTAVTRDAVLRFKASLPKVVVLYDDEP